MIISFYTLGCKVNQYETEMLKERFKEKGHEITDEEAFADVYVINTCTVTSLADRKSRQYIRRMKKKNQDAIIAVTGCYAQIKPEEVSAIDGVDIVTGTNQKGQIVELVEKFFENTADKKSIKETEDFIVLPADANDTSIKNRKTKTEVICVVKDGKELTEYEETGIITSMESRTRAYIKVQEGCNRFCSYCIIPYARGQVRSRNPKDVVAEAQSLLDQGFKEIILTGINTALYGTEKGFKEKYQMSFEIKNNPKQCDDDATYEGVDGIEILIKALNDLPGDFRIRLSSLEPTVINKDYVKGLLKYEKLCHHLHLSIQSGSNSILKAMNRRYTREEYLEIVRELQQFDSGYGITTDIIVGFPGETEEDFQDSLDIAEKAGFCRVHPFKYSKRNGTKAAEMSSQINGEIKKDRMNCLLEKSENVSQKFYRDCFGRKERVLTEEYAEDGKYIIGYSGNYIKTYIPLGENSIIPKDCFVEVVLKEPYKDGVLAALWV